MLIQEAALLRKKIPKQLLIPKKKISSFLNIKLEKAKPALPDLSSD